MYTSVNICQRFSRLKSADGEADEIPAIKEEISYLFNDNTSQDFVNPYRVTKYVTLKGRRFCVRNFGEMCKVFYSIAMKMHRQAEDVLLADNTLPTIRDMTEIHEYITELLSIHRSIVLERGKHENVEFSGELSFTTYKNSFLRFTELPEDAVQKLTSGLLSKQSESTQKMYFHLLLDILWLLLTLNPQKPTEKCVEDEIVDILKEIHFITFKLYQKTSKFHVVCSCLKVIYLRLQIYTEKMSFEYWEVFNKSMTSFPEEFSLYLLKFNAELQLYTQEGYMYKDDLDLSHFKGRKAENFEFFNKNWAILMKNAEILGEAKIGRILSYLEELLTTLWLEKSKLEFFYQTWEFYCRKIEDILEKRSFTEVFAIFNTKMENGYLIFLRMLRKHLENHPHHWNKFKGRIYTKFPPARFQKLSEQGLHNLGILFFTLGNIGGNFDEIGGKFLGLLKDLPEKKQNCLIVWNIYIFMLKQHLDQGVPITNVHSIFNPLLEAAAKNRTQFHLLTTFVSNFEGFFKVTDLTLKQSLLIGTWLELYIKSCAHNELISLLNTLTRVINHTVENGVWYEYQPVFVSNILAPLKRLQVGSPVVGTVAGLIVANSEGLDHIVEHFIAENVPTEVVFAFFGTLSRKSTLTTNQRREFLILKAWFLCEMVRDEGMGFASEFYPDLLKQNEGRNSIGSGLTEGRRRSAIGVSLTEGEIQTKGGYSSGMIGQKVNKFEVFLQLADRETILACLKDSQGFLARNLCIKVYTQMALVFHYCGRFIYMRTASTCYLSTFIDMFLLPMELLRGSRPSCVAHVEKTWHLFMFALWQLSSEDNDPYLERLLKDLTLKYMPLFGMKTTPPVLKITTNFDLSQFVFKKIAGEFFEQNKSKHHLSSDEVVFKVLSIVNLILDDLIEDGTKVDVLIMFVQVFLLPLFEVYMFKNHKVLAMDMVKKMAALKAGRADVGRLFSEALTSAMLKHIAFGTNQFFQLCYVLVKVVGGVVRGMLGRIKEEISMLECKRGQGFDNHLRQSYDRLVKMC